MLYYIRAAVNGEFKQLFTKCHEDVSYFNEVTSSLTIDVLIDCGAYDGDSIHDFVDVFSEYKKIYAFEPDAINREKIKKELKMKR